MARTRVSRRGLSTLIVAFTVMATIGALPTTAQASPPQAPEPNAPSEPSTPLEDIRFVPYPGEIAPMAESGDITAGGCTYRQAVDNPHVTSGDASVHGWWLRRAGTCPSRANVDIHLQAFGCGPFVCQWITVASGSKDVLPGGGAGRRANARLDCASTSTVGWRGLVDVDLIGVNDPPGFTESTIRNLACSPPG